MRLGKSSVEISRVVLGCMWAENTSEAEIQRIVHAAYDAGITAFDTAPLYGFHSSEQIIGRALKDRRDRVQLLTKAGLSWDDDHGEVLFEFQDASGRRRAVRKDSRPEKLVSEVESSLKRLGTDVIDLLQIHHPDSSTPLEDSLGALSRLVEQGKVRALGVSNFSPPQLARAQAVLAGESPLAALQCEYNLIERWPEHELVDLCGRHELALLAYSPLAKGVLAGARSRGPARSRASDGSLYGQPLVRPLIQAAVADTLAPLAARHGVEAGEIALAWLLASGPSHAVVVGASSAEQACRNARAQAVTLSASEVRSLRARFARLDLPLKALKRALALPGISRASRLARRVLSKLR
jgi:aryl-alcohol dehydrogenase-like predicted oxidoreductase